MAYSLKQNDVLLLVASLLCMGGSVLSAFLYFSLPSTPNKDIEVLPSAIQDLGQVKQATSRSITYSIVNIGSETLQISDVVTSCGCVTTSISRKEIAPGEKSVLALSYDSGQARGAVHIVAHVIYSSTSTDGYESLPLEAKGEIDPDYGIKPERLQFECGKRFSQRLVVWPRHTKDLNVTSVTCDKRFFTAHVVEQTVEGQVQIEVAFDPSEYYQDAGPAQLSITTTSQVQPVARVPIEVIQ
jgi:hypothetical protein